MESKITVIVLAASGPQVIMKRDHERRVNLQDQ
jgi:hypothetical protein